MRLANLRDGDIVEINDGMPYLAIVRGRRGRRLVVDPIGGKFQPAPVKPADVTGHWRKVRPRQPHANGDEPSRDQPAEAEVS